VAEWATVTYYLAFENQVHPIHLVLGAGGGWVGGILGGFGGLWGGWGGLCDLLFGVRKLSGYDPPGFGGCPGGFEESLVGWEDRGVAKKAFASLDRTAHGCQEPP